MTKKSFKQALKDARRELQRLYLHREETDREIARMRQAVIHLGRLCEDEWSTEQLKWLTDPDIGKGKEGLTNSVRSVLLATKEPLNPLQIRRLLIDIGYETKGANPMVSIHVVLRNLVRQGEVRRCRFPRPAGEIQRVHGYWWGDADPPAPWVVLPEKGKK